MERGQLLPIFLALGLFLGTVLAAALGLVYSPTSTNKRQKNTGIPRYS